MKLTLVSFLKKVITASLKRLVKVVEIEVRKDGPTAVMATTAAVSIMKKMRMVRGLELFEIALTCLFAEKGEPVPEAIARLFATSTSVSTAVVSVPTKPIPAEKFFSVPVKPVPATAPARTLKQEEKTPEQRRDGWFKILLAFVEGKMRIDPEKTCGLTAAVLRSGVALTRKHWEVFFAAMKKADEIGFSVTGKAVDPVKMFASAPTDLIDNHLFGQDGMMITTLANFSELKADKMPGWLIARTWVLVAALSAIENQLDEFGTGRIQVLLAAVEKLDGPEKLIGAIQSLLPTGEPAPPSAGGLRIAGNIRAVAVAADAARANRAGETTVVLQ